MMNVNEKRYPNISEAVAFRIAFAPMAYSYGDIGWDDKEYINENGYPYSFITKEVLDDLHDLNVTYEKYEMYLPYWVVSRRVYDFLIKRYPRMNFEPIFLNE